jgi:ADP-ribose pyrophosphatase
MQQKGPWQVTSSESVYHNHWMKVREDQVIRPDGEPGIFGVVTFMPGVSVLPITEDGYAYVTEEYRYAIGHNSIEAASGGIEGGASPLETAKKELQEETGLTATEWIDCGMVDPLTSTMVSQQYMFVARGLKHGKSNPEGTEVITVHKIKLDELYQMVLDGKITHAPTCVLILRAKLVINS